jgi:hypothetical protein
VSNASAGGKPWQRFITEGVVIVSSILLAFAIDAWWDGRQDEARGKSYVAMLADDLEQTLRNNDTFSARADSVDWAGARLVRAYFQPELPPPDSIVRWLLTAGSWYVVQASLGAAEGLVASGDIGLISSDSIRAALPGYLSAMNAFEGFEQYWADTFLAARAELQHHVDIEQLRLTLISPAARDSLAMANNLYPYPAGGVRRLPSIDVETLVRNREVHRILSEMNAAKANMRRERVRMRTATEQFLNQLSPMLAN